jgi:hypothetical protein
LAIFHSKLSVLTSKRILLFKFLNFLYSVKISTKFQLHGRGFDPVVMSRDLNMFEWLHANCYRTSHYPYNELRAYEADRRGIVVITEVPAVGIL